MADIYIFFEEGIKSYIEQSFAKYSKNEEIIFKKNFDNDFLNTLFINDISLYKNLIQKNKLKSEIWGIIGILLDQKIKQILQKFNEFLDKKRNKILKYSEDKKKSSEKIKMYEKMHKEIEEEINNNVISNNNCNEEESEIKNEEKEDLSDVKCKESVASDNQELLKKIMHYNNLINDEKEKVKKYEKDLNHKEKIVMIGEINILKFKILTVSTSILIDDISNQKVLNKDYNVDDNYKLLNNFISDFIDKCEKIKDNIHIEYYTFIRVYIIELVKIINLQGYKDINKKFLSQLLTSINLVKKTYSNSYISDLIKYIEKLISKPDTFLCRNAFTILKDASLKKIKPRSRNNSFDKNDVVNNNNNPNNKIEGNRKIDEFIKIKKREEKSDSEDDEDDFQKKLSNVISFKNSSTQNNNPNLNFQFQSQSSLGLLDTYKNKSLINDSAFSNNSLIYIENRDGTNLLNSSKLSLDDSISKQGGMYRSGSYSELLGINSRLASQLPTLRNTKKEKQRNILEKFGKKMRMKKLNIERKSSNEKLDKIFGKEIRNIVNKNFYSNEGIRESTYNKNKNTTATENKKNKNTMEKNNEKKNSESDILAVKTPVKNTEENNSTNKKEENTNINNNILKQTGIKRNLQLLFNQQTDKF